MEIEKKYLIKELPDLSKYEYVDIEQGYISTSPVLRIRKKSDKFIFTYKGAGLMAREEIESPIDEEAYNRLKKKVDGHLITKRRYLIPFDPYLIELDIFSGNMEGLVMAEVEFPSIEEANSFNPPAWFGAEVTSDRAYHNSNMIYNDSYKA
ncbi:MAG: CYTH domain-containing protein [Pseudobutyrivibrio sp.]|nr:CYTH domain-containing protein [Pseudobutyrivibrio sp.]